MCNKSWNVHSYNQSLLLLQVSQAGLSVPFQRRLADSPSSWHHLSPESGQLCRLEAAVAPRWEQKGHSIFSVWVCTELPYLCWWLPPKGLAAGCSSPPAECNAPDVSGSTEFAPPPGSGRHRSDSLNLRCSSVDTTPYGGGWESRHIF